MGSTVLAQPAVGLPYPLVSQCSSGRDAVWGVMQPQKISNNCARDSSCLSQTGSIHVGFAQPADLRACSMTTISQPSVQSLLIEMRFNGQPLSTGTAFVVQAASGPYLVTNRHNVTGRRQDNDELLSRGTGAVPNEILVLHNRHGNLGQWVPRVEPLYDGDKPRWREHPVLGAKADFVALRLTQLNDVALFPYDAANVGPAILVGPADSVSVIGFPFGMTAGGVFGVWATGFLASEMDVDFNDLPIVLIDCRSRQGQSGSPVIAYRSGGGVAMAGGGQAMFQGPVWKFIGIYSGRINAESDLGIVWKASAVNELVQSL